MLIFFGWISLGSIDLESWPFWHFAKTLEIPPQFADIVSIAGGNKAEFQELHEAYVTRCFAGTKGWTFGECFARCSIFASWGYMFFSWCCLIVDHGSSLCRGITVCRYIYQHYKHMIHFCSHLSLIQSMQRKYPNPMTAFWFDFVQNHAFIVRTLPSFGWATDFAQATWQGWLKPAGGYSWSTMLICQFSQVMRVPRRRSWSKEEATSSQNHSTSVFSSC